MATLYELTGKYQQLLQIADEVDPEVFKDTLESIDGTIEDKAINYAKVDRQMGADIDDLKTEIKRITQRMNSLTNNRKRLRENLMASMQATGKTKIKDKLFTINVQKNRKSIEINNKKLPAYLMIEEKVYKPDKDRVKELLDEGKEIPGANYKPQTYHVVIR